MNQFTRTELIFGKDAMEKLYRAHVAVFGVGGVGGFAVEALARSGVGELSLIDDDTVCLSNLNRQIIATHDTLGKYKVDVAKERVLSINPNATVHTYKTFFTPETADLFDFTRYDYVIDAIDTVAGKIALVLQAKKAKTPIICSMGAGNKVNPCGFIVSDISKTSVCPLAKVMRTELKKRGIRGVKAVWSKEIPLSHAPDAEELTPETGTVRTAPRRATPGSTAFVPSVAGLILAGEVIKDITGFYGKGSGA